MGTHSTTIPRILNQTSRRNASNDQKGESMTLRTLKDFEPEAQSQMFMDAVITDQLIDNLREVAREHIKDLKKYEKRLRSEFNKSLRDPLTATIPTDVYLETLHHINGQMYAFEMFFNLEDEVSQEDN